MISSLKNLFTQYWTYLAVNAACEIRLFDLIENSAPSIDELVKDHNFSKNSLNSLLRVLESEGLIQIDSKLTLTTKGEFFTENHPETLLYACMHWADEHMSAWQNLSYTIRTGQSSFEKKYGEKYFDYLSKRPERLDAYHKAMFPYAIEDYRKLGQQINFSKFKSVMDVGGGYGALIMNLKKDYPNIDFTLFDLPEVVDNVNIENIKIIGGSFFAKIPGTFDCIILSRVLHDWPDDETKNILKNCYNSLVQDGTLYVIEILTDLVEEKPSLLNLNMALICNSYERSFLEYSILLKNVGFRTIRSSSLNDLQSVIEAIK